MRYAHASCELQRCSCSYRYKRLIDSGLGGAGQQKPPANVEDNRCDVSLINYDLLIKESLKLVVRRSLEQVAESGLYGNQHFYVTFRTDFKGVQIPEYLHEEYPEELTIVLENQFWNLKVFETYFEVSLNFNTRVENIVVPFDSVLEFSDPSEDFVLQFDSEDMGENMMPKNDESELTVTTDKETDDNKVVSLDMFRKK